MTHRPIIVNAQGRVTIPAAIRRQIGVHTGEELIAHVVDGQLILETTANVIRRVGAAIKRRAQDRAEGSGGGE